MFHLPQRKSSLMTSYGWQVEVICCCRLIVAKIGVFYTFFLAPETNITGIVGLALRGFYGQTISFSYLLYPLLSLEIVTNTLVMMGVWMTSRSCVIPWLLWNFLCLLLASLAIIHGLVKLITEEPKDKTEMHTLLWGTWNLVWMNFLVIIILLLVVQLSSVLRACLTMSGEDDAIGETGPMKPTNQNDRGRDRSNSHVNMYSSSCQEPNSQHDITERSSLNIFQDNSNITADGDQRDAVVAGHHGQDSRRESWNTFKFSLEDEKFS